ncbi:MAG: NAD(P)-dependent oxidoreductase [bacterium]
MIAFLGTGLLGANFVRALQSRGETVHVWNRTASKAQALEQYGAKAFDDPADAVRGADRVHITLVDDAGVNDVLERARSGLAQDVIIVDHTTTSPVGTKERVQRWAARGIRFQHAPVFMGPPQALSATGVMLASGEQALFEALKPHLEQMTGNLVYLGADPARAAAMKLMGNHYLIVLNTAIADTVSLAKGLGVPQEEVAHLFEFFNPTTMVQGRLNRLLTVDYADPSWTLAMARKDVRLMLEGADAGHASLLAVPAIAAKMDEWIAKGNSSDDWTVITKDQLRG